MSETKKTYTRRMDDLGNINIPKDIQQQFGIKATELPEFTITVCDSCKSIKLMPVQTDKQDNS